MGKEEIDFYQNVFQLYLDIVPQRKFSNIDSEDEFEPKATVIVTN